MAHALLKDRAIEEVIDTLKQKYAHLERSELKQCHPMKAYVAYYKKFGYSYHVLAQLESVLKGKKPLTANNGLLSAMFLSEIETMLLTAGHDRTRLHLPLRLKLSKGEEVYTSISGKEVTAVEGDMVVCSGEEILSSILRGPDYGSRITASTENVLFVIYAPEGIEASDVKRGLKGIETRVRAVAPAATTEMLRVF